MYIKSLSLFLKLARASFLKTQSKEPAASPRRLGARPPVTVAWNPAAASLVTAGSARAPWPPLSGSRTWMLRSRARRPFRPVERRVRTDTGCLVTFGGPRHWDGRERAGAQANRVRALEARSQERSIRAVRFRGYGGFRPPPTLPQGCIKKRGGVTPSHFRFLSPQWPMLLE